MAMTIAMTTYSLHHGNVHVVVANNATAPPSSSVGEYFSNAHAVRRDPGMRPMAPHVNSRAALVLVVDATSCSSRRVGPSRPFTRPW